MNFGPMEWLVIILLVIILFGAKRIPDVAKGLGEGIRSFKSGLLGDEKKLEEERRARENSNTKGDSHKSA